MTTALLSTPRRAAQSAVGERFHQPFVRGLGIGCDGIVAMGVMLREFDARHAGAADPECRRGRRLREKKGVCAPEVQEMPVACRLGRRSVLANYLAGPLAQRVSQASMRAYEVLVA